MQVSANPTYAKNQKVIKVLKEEHHFSRRKKWYNLIVKRISNSPPQAMFNLLNFNALL